MLSRWKKFSYVTVCLFLFLAAGLKVKAAENNAVEGTLQQIATDTEVKESADAGSATVGNLPAGTPVIVEESDGSWSKITYQEIRGYIPDSALQPYGAAPEENLWQEFQDVYEEEERIVYEYELSMKERRNSIIWGSVIAVLIIAIFAVGVVTALKNNRDDEEEEEETEDIEIEDMDMEDEDIEDEDIEDIGMEEEEE